MDAEVFMRPILVVIVIVSILLGTVHALYTSSRYNQSANSSFGQVIKVLLLSACTCDVFNLVSLLLATASGGWSLGLGACEVVGFISTVLTTCTSWMLAIATIERYFVLVLTSELTSTFSVRNIQIMVTGVYLLVMMAATGPFYGFGEYTYMRGYLEVVVSSNISMPIHTHPMARDAKLESIHQLFSHLRRSSYIDPEQNLLESIAKHIQANYDIIISKANWLPHGILFYIRAMDMGTLDTFMQHYRDKVFVHNVTGISLVEDVAMSLNISDSEVMADISLTDFMRYRNWNMPIQDLGLCTSDMTSPNRHVGIWAGFYVMMTFVLPYFLILIGLCIIYARNFTQLTYSDKHGMETDIRYTNNVCSVAMATCFVMLFYFVVVLLHVNGSYVSPVLMFWSTVMFFARSLIYIIALKFDVCTCRGCECNCRWLLRLCGLYAKGALSYELSEYDASRTLTNDSSSKGTPLMTNV